MKVKKAKKIIELVKSLGIGNVKSLRNPIMTVQEEVDMMSKSLLNKDDSDELGRGVALSFERMEKAYTHLKGMN